MNKTISESGYRSRSDSQPGDRLISLWKGMPAAILAILGLGALVFAAERSSRLEQRYQRLAEDTSKKREELSESFLNDLRMLQSGQENKTVDELIPPDDKRRQTLAELWANEQLYYEKLISLNSANSSYRFNYALACLRSKSDAEIQRGYSLLQALAPMDQPGYYKAHLWWIENITQAVRARQVPPRQGLEMIYTHAEHCLKRQSTEKLALRTKAEAAFALGRNEDALEAYQILFQEDPSFYVNLVSLNNRMQKPEGNADIYRNAKARLELSLQSKASGDKWMKNWEGLLNCMIGLDEHELAVTKLREEIAHQVNKRNTNYQIYLEQMLAKALVTILRKGNVEFAKFTAKDVELMREAHQLDPKNVEILQVLTHIALADDAELAAMAKQIYDPMKDDSPPAAVLNEIGTLALARKDYDQSAQYLEQALQLDPRNPKTLNNLAYIYLVGNKPNPERALKLVEEAIRVLKSSENLTYFLDTKATALMQLKRLPEAIATFELALKDRPDNIKIIESLIACYEASNLSAEAYKDRLKRLTENR